MSDKEAQLIWEAYVAEDWRDTARAATAAAALGVGGGQIGHQIGQQQGYQQGQQQQQQQSDAEQQQDMENRVTDAEAWFQLIFGPDSSDFQKNVNIAKSSGSVPTELVIYELERQGFITIEQIAHAREQGNRRIQYGSKFHSYFPHITFSDAELPIPILDKKAVQTMWREFALENLDEPVKPPYKDPAPSLFKKTTIGDWSRATMKDAGIDVPPNLAGPRRKFAYDNLLTVTLEVTHLNS